MVLTYESPECDHWAREYLEALGPEDSVYVRDNYYEMRRKTVYQEVTSEEHMTGKQETNVSLYAENARCPLECSRWQQNHTSKSL